MASLDLEFQKDPRSDQYKLYKIRGRIPDLLCEWHNRKALIQDWLDGRDDRNFSEVLEELPRILIQSSHLDLEQKQTVADWVIDSLFSERLPPKWEDVLCRTVGTLLFDILIPLFPSSNEKLKKQLHYTLRRWFTLVKDPGRSCFEREKDCRERAVRDAIFDPQNHKIYSFYALPGFHELAETFARWFVIRYDLIISARIHASLYQISDNVQSCFKKPWSPIAHLFRCKYCWVLTLVVLLLVILTGLCLRLSGNSALSAFIVTMAGSIIFLLLFLVLVPPDLRLLRMLGAIGVGYILLLITADVWKFAFRIWRDHTAQAGIIFFLSLLASFLYLVVEMGGKVPSGCQRCRRGLLVLGLGLGQSLLVGIISCSLTGEIFATEVIEMQEKMHDFAKFQIHWNVYSLDFVVYPEVVLFFAPVALFVGIFSQILWEEKEVTSPL